MELVSFTHLIGLFCCLCVQEKSKGSTKSQSARIGRGIAGGRDANGLAKVMGGGKSPRGDSHSSTSSEEEEEAEEAEKEDSDAGSESESDEKVDIFKVEPTHGKRKKRLEAESLFLANKFVTLPLVTTLLLLLLLSLLLLLHTLLLYYTSQQVRDPTPLHP